LCELTVNALLELPTIDDSADFRLGIAEIFGASVANDAAQERHAAGSALARLDADYPTVDEVVCAFPPQVARLLDPRSVGSA
jgi:hypothetical protein